MGNRKEGVYSFTLKRKELIAVVAGILVTYVMVFILGYTLGKEATPVVYQQSVQQDTLAQEEPSPSSSGLPEEKEQPVFPENEKKTVSVEGSALNRSVSQVEIPVKPVKPKEKSSPFRFFVQAGAFSKPSSAQSLKKRLEEKGYKVQIMKIGALYKVLIGPFVSEEEARASKKKLVRDEKIYGYIVKY